MDHHKPIYPLPTPAELVAFSHGAAGHQGISSNAAGDLIIKPCTQAEIDFYEAAKKYPDFQVHMPIYMGKLELGDKTAAEVLSPVSKSGTSVSNEPSITSQNEAGEVKADSVAQEKPSSEQTSEKKETKAWVPSGGKKLNTGLAIVLENTTAAFKRPNVMDLKLGSRLWDDNAPEPKRQKLDQVAANTTSGSLGFRVAGAKIWLGHKEGEADREVHTEIKDGYKCYDKLFGQSLDDSTVQKAIARFLSGPFDQTVLAKDKTWFIESEPALLTEKLIRELENIQYVLEHQESRMYSASVLVVIEGDRQALQHAIQEEKELEARTGHDTTMGAKDEGGKETEAKEKDDDEDDSDEDEGEQRPKVMEVRLIDFAHAQFTPGQGPDENALRGIRNIIKVLKEISK